MSYTKGRRFEYIVKKMLEQDPETILCVRSSGSHGAIDLVRIKLDSTCELYQCKNTKAKSYVPKDDVDLNIIAKVVPTFWAERRMGRTTFTRVVPK